MAKKKYDYNVYNGDKLICATNDLTEARRNLQENEGSAPNLKLVYSSEVCQRICKDVELDESGSACRNNEIIKAKSGHGSYVHATIIGPNNSCREYFTWVTEASMSCKRREQV